MLYTVAIDSAKALFPESSSRVERMEVDQAMDAPRQQENLRQPEMQATMAMPVTSVLQESNKLDDQEISKHSSTTATATATIKPVVRVPPRMMFGPYCERYLSPTDSLVSPVSRGLMWRNHRRPVRKLIPPVAPKALESTFVCVNDANSRK